MFTLLSFHSDWPIWRPSSISSLKLGGQFHAAFKLKNLLSDDLQQTLQEKERKKKSLIYISIGDTYNINLMVS